MKSLEQDNSKRLDDTIRECADDLEMDIVGEQFGEFTIIREIGRGGMAVVFEAFQKSLNRKVALKVLGKRFENTPGLVERFSKEARAAAKLSHPNIVQVLALGSCRGYHYYAMEYIKGESLRTILELEKSLSIPDALNIVIQVAGGLRYAFSEGIIHRDIKPGNIVITEEGNVKIADFGLAKVLTEHSSNAANEGVVGTALYISPEQAQGRPVDHRTDIYALGATFYHLLAGVPPFQGKTRQEVLVKHINAPVGALDQEFSVVNDVVTRLLAKDPEERCKSYEELMALLYGVRDVLNRKHTSWFLGKQAIVTYLSILVGISVITSWLYYKYPLDRRHSKKEAQRIAKDRKLRKIASMDAFQRAEQDVSVFLKKEEFEQAIDAMSAVMHTYPEQTNILFMCNDIMKDVRKQVASKYFSVEREATTALRDGEYARALTLYDDFLARGGVDKYKKMAQANLDEIRFVQAKTKSQVYIEHFKFENARSILGAAIERIEGEAFRDTLQKQVDSITKLERLAEELLFINDEFTMVREQAKILALQNRAVEAQALLQDFIARYNTPQWVKRVGIEMKRIDQLLTVYKDEPKKERFLLFLEQLRKYVAKYDYVSAEGLCTKMAVHITQEPFARFIQDKKEEIVLLRELQDRIVKSRNSLPLIRKAPYKTTREKLILPLGGGYIGVPWSKCHPKEIYELSKQSVDSDDFTGRLGIVVYTTVYNLLETAEQELRYLIEDFPEKEDFLHTFYVRIQGKRKLKN